MEVSENLPSQVSVEMSTVVIVKNRCQFCYAFSKDAEKIAEHSNRCVFRFSETFEASDGKVKFACAVCFDVFQTRAEHARHEQLHKFPGGFPCSICDESFLNDLECVQHLENDHGVFNIGHDGGHNAFACHDCGAFFEQKNHLRLHKETNCGKHRSWHCPQCGPKLLTADAYSAHMESVHKSVVEVEDECAMPTVEITLNKNPIITASRNLAEQDDVTEDPLLFVPKDEKCHDAVADSGAIPIAERDMDGISKSLAQETTTETFNEESVTYQKHTSNTDYIPKIGIGEKYECKYCDKKYITKFSFDRHTAKHGPNGSRVHLCDCCYAYFATIRERNLHARTEHEERLTCQICNRIFQSAACLHAHKRFPHNEREENMECGSAEDALETREQSDCGARPATAESSVDRSSRTRKQYTRKSTRKEPKPKPIGDKKFKCKYCRNKYRKKRRLDEHTEDHGPDGSLLHRCDVCTIYFKTTEERDVHSQTAHKEKPECSICNQTFRSLLRLQRHKRVFHAGGKPKEKRKPKKQQYFCAKCGVRFSNKKYLDDHEQSDCGRLPRYKCDECGKCLATKSSLKFHMMTHTDVRNYTCSHCAKAFRHSGGLTLHIRYQHTNERPFKCDHCEKRFVDLSSLKVHMTIHTGIKRWICYGCGDRYPTNSALHKHRNARKNTCALVPIQKPLKMAESESGARKSHE